MDGTKVRGDEALEIPFGLQFFVLQVIVLAAELAVDLRIGGHDGGNMALFHGRHKRGQVDFAQGAFADDFVDGEAVGFLVVGGVMLDVGDFALALDAPGSRSRQTG